jgi:predicted dehydrogenase
MAAEEYIISLLPAGACLAMTFLDRRQFVRGSAAGLFFLNAPRIGTRVRRRSPNEELGVAVVGIRGRGGNHIEGFRRLPDVRIVALCDVDEEVLAGQAQKFIDRGETVATYTDLRHVLERDDVDVVSIATPNHWHALQAIWACQAGKDVYLEKPVSHNIWEGRKIVEAARKYDRIVQTGTQCRSSQAIGEAIDWLQAGNLGSIKVARGFCYKPRKSIGKVDGPQQVAETIDYDMWLGPAPLEALERERLHYDWHWVYDTGNGDVGNQGIHQMDICRWALGEPALPPGVLSVGGRFGYDDDANTPNTQVVFLDYEKAPLIFEVRGLPRDLAAQGEEWNKSMDDYHGIRIGVVVECEGGSLRVPNYSSAVALDDKGEEIQSWQGAQDHYANFVAAVRSRQHEDLAADIEQGHISSALCHMGNVSHLRGGRSGREEARKAFQSTPLGSESMERMFAHLDANRVDPEKEPVILGRWLGFDPQTETFTDDEQARKMISREYREPYAVPDVV